MKFNILEKRREYFHHATFFNLSRIDTMNNYLDHLKWTVDDYYLHNLQNIIILDLWTKSGNAKFWLERRKIPQQESEEIEQRYYAKFAHCVYIL